MIKTARTRRPDPRAKTREGVLEAVHACDEKKALDISILELEEGSGAFTDYFVICTGSNPRQIQAISDEVEQRLSSAGNRPTHVEGYIQAEWILLDYVDFVVHIFSENARKFYDLERLWKSAKRMVPADLTATRPTKPRRTATASRRPRSGRALSKAGPPATAGRTSRNRRSAAASSDGRKAGTQKAGRTASKKPKKHRPGK